ncbi:hypothetical protein J6590_026238 [Homalodisca vitripennis]|nr:hypothetical protein J6590_026238 [Homalodisca vitripennis]
MVEKCSKCCEDISATAKDGIKCSDCTTVCHLKCVGVVTRNKKWKCESCAVECASNSSKTSETGTASSTILDAIAAFRKENNDKWDSNNIKLDEVQAEVNTFATNRHIYVPLYYKCKFKTGNLVGFLKSWSSGIPLYLLTSGIPLVFSWWCFASTADQVIQDHTEITQVDFDPKIVSYEELLDMFWKNHDPTFKTKTQYCSLILYHSPEQKSLAEKTRDEFKKTSKDEVLTRIEPFETFYDAEGYHQKYHLQEHASLLPTLGFQKDDERLKTSHLASKINAYLVGMSTVEQFDTEVASLGLDEETTKYIREYNVQNQGRGMTC